MGANARGLWLERHDESAPRPAEPEPPPRAEQAPGYDPLSLIALQRSAGNHAVSALLGGSSSRIDPNSGWRKPEGDLSSSALLQRLGPRAAIGQIGDKITTWQTDVRGVLTPQDNFAGRTLSQFGVGEVIDLSFVAPNNAAFYGGLQWVIRSGGGAIVSANDGTGTYTAPGDPATVRLELQVAAGANAGDVMATKTFEVIGIEDARMERDTGQGVWHRNGTASVGFKANIYFRPKTVSFQWAQMQEGTAPGRATGFMREHGKAGEVHAATGFWVDILGGDSARGSELDGTDTVATGEYGMRPGRRGNMRFKSGTFTWDIPWYYKGPGGAQHKITTATHYESVDANGRASIKKHGAGPERKNANDPDSDY